MLRKNKLCMLHTWYPSQSSHLQSRHITQIGSKRKISNSDINNIPASSLGKTFIMMTIKCLGS